MLKGPSPLSLPVLKDVPFLEHWSGQHQSAVIALHPFAMVKGRHPFADGEFASVFAKQARPIHPDLADPLPELAAILRDSTPIQKRHALELAELRGANRARTISWVEVAAACGLDGIRGVMIALLSSIGSLSERLHDEQGAAALIQWAEREEVFVPSEGVFQPRHAELFSEWLSGKGVTSVTFSPEFDFDGEQTVQMSTEQLDGERGTFACPELGISAIVEWDSFYTVVAGPRIAIDDIARILGPDALLVTAETTSKWWSERGQALSDK